MVPGLAIGRLPRPLENKTRRLNDTSNSAYEFSLAKYCYLCGLTTEQVAAVISAWWIKHKITGDYDRLTQRIMPAAWEQARPSVEAFQEERQSKAAGKTANRILAYIYQYGSAMPAEVATALDISRQSAFNLLKRLAVAGQLAHSQTGTYTLPTRIHTGNVYVEFINSPASDLSQPRPMATASGAAGTTAVLAPVHMPEEAAA